MHLVFWEDPLCLWLDLEKQLMKAGFGGWGIFVFEDMTSKMPCIFFGVL